MEKKVGDIAEINVPAGKVEFEVLEIFKVMPSIFTRIVEGEIPSYKVAEDDRFLAFLDINPLAEGHTLSGSETGNRLPL